jgi:hypothetical protein
MEAGKSMVRCAYNPQEVLSPLMQRFGRHLRGGRAEGFNQMVAAVSEALRVEKTSARYLVQALASAGLIDFELDSPIGPDGRPEGPLVSGKPATAASVRAAVGAAGVWRIGPSV